MNVESSTHDAGAPPHSPVCAVVVGAGSGKRFGGGPPKAFAELSTGESLLHLTLRRLAASPLVDFQVAVVPSGREEHVRSWPDLDALRVNGVVPGGTHRSQSVMNGLTEASRLAPENAVVLIHDAARPCLSTGLVARIVQGVLAHGNATPTVPVADTIKLAEDDLLTETLQRGSLAAVQTPQGFLLGQHIRLLELHPGPHLDDTIPWTLEGRQVFRVTGDRWNFKVTYPEDLPVVEAVLRGSQCSG